MHSPPQPNRHSQLRGPTTRVELLAMSHCCCESHLHLLGVIILPADVPCKNWHCKVEGSPALVGFGMQDHVNITRLVLVKSCRCTANWALALPSPQLAEAPVLDPRKMLLPCLQLLLHLPCSSSAGPWLPAGQGAPGPGGLSHLLRTVSRINHLVLDTAMLLMCSVLLPVSAHTPRFWRLPGACHCCQDLFCHGSVVQGNCVQHDLWLRPNASAQAPRAGLPHTVPLRRACMLPCLHSWLCALICALQEEGRPEEATELLLEWSQAVPAPVSQPPCHPVVSLLTPGAGDPANNAAGSARVARAWGFRCASRGREWLLLLCLVRCLGAGAVGSLEWARDEAGGEGWGGLGSAFCVMLLLDMAFSLLLQRTMEGSSSSDNTRGVPGSSALDLGGAGCPEATEGDVGVAEGGHRSMTLSLFSDWLQKASRLPTGDPRPDAPLVRCWGHQKSMRSCCTCITWILS